MKNIKKKKIPNVMKKISKESMRLTDESLNDLKRLFPSIFSEGKIDFEKLKILLGDQIEDSIEKYNFTWAGRSDAFRNIQTTAKGTLIPNEKDSVDFEKTGNLFIEGDNLEVLKLLQKSYQNKIKMIYIDPPYNTGKDFVYKDNFKDSIGNYEKITGQVDEEGNRTDTNKESNGRFHSDWLTMMYPRLYLAKNLLKDDGVIFVSIDDHEVHNLRKIMDDIFGEENFILGGVVNRASEIADNFTISKHEYFIVYSKNKGEFSLGGNERHTISRGTVGNQDQTMPVITFPKGLKCIGVKDGTYSQTRKIKNSNENIENLEPIIVKNGSLAKEVRLKARWRSSNDMRNFFDNNCKPTIAKINGIIEEIYFEGDRFMPQIKKRIVEKIPSMILDNKRGSKDLENLGLNKLFDNPKSVNFLIKIIDLCSSSEDIVLDFFSGSGTFAQAVLELNNPEKKRRFICVQLPENLDKNLLSADGSAKVTIENSINFLDSIKKPHFLTEISKERIRRIIKKIKEEDKEKSKNMDLGFKVFKLSKSNYKIWENYGGKDVKELLKQMELFQSPLIAGYKKINLIYEILIKEGCDLNSKIEEVKEIKKNKVFKIDNGEKFFYICLDEKIKEQTIKDLKLNKEIMFVCLDDSLDDNQKINLSLKINLRSI